MNLKVKYGGGGLGSSVIPPANGPLTPQNNTPSTATTVTGIAPSLIPKDNQLLNNGTSTSQGGK